MPINFKWHLGNIREKLRGGVVVDNSALPWNSETVAGTIYWHTATQADPSSRQSRRSTSPTQGDGVISPQPAPVVVTRNSLFTSREILRQESGDHWLIVFCLQTVTQRCSHPLTLVLMPPRYTSRGIWHKYDELYLSSSNLASWQC